MPFPVSRPSGGATDRSGWDPRRRRRRSVLPRRAILSGLALFAGLLSGLAAALWGSRQELAGAARTGGTERSPSRSRLRAALLVAQVAFTCALLIGSGLFVRSLRNLQHLSLGLEPERVMVATTESAGSGAPRPATRSRGCDAD